MANKPINSRNTAENAAEPPYDIWEDKIPFIIPKGKEETDDVYVCVCGRPFIIQRGARVDELPRPVFEVLRDREMAIEARNNYIAANESINRM